MKDTRTGMCWVKDYNSELELFEVEGSGLRAIRISHFEFEAQLASVETAGVERETDGMEMDEDPEVGVPVLT